MGESIGYMGTASFTASRTDATANADPAARSAERMSKVGSYAAKAAAMPAAEAEMHRDTRNGFIVCEPPRPAPGRPATR
jgi:hypothetical protein